MTSAARQLSHQPDASAPSVVVLRASNPYYRGLCETYRDLKRALRQVKHRSDPASLVRARQLDRARLLLLEAIVES